MNGFPFNPIRSWQNNTGPRDTHLIARAITADTGPIKAEGRVVHRGRQVATSEGDLRDGAGKLLAHGTSTCLIVGG